MSKSLTRRAADISYKILKPYGLFRIRRFMSTIKRNIDPRLDLKRKTPFLLLGNHQYLVDSGIYGTIWKRKPITVISRSLMLTPYRKFHYKFVASGIPKSQGEAEISVTRQLIKTVRNGDPLMILPEGEMTYFGETLPFDDGIAKLAKMLKIDVITAVSHGGHISSPRWAYHRRQHTYVEVNFKLLLTKQEVKEKSLEEVNKAIHDELYVNDYEWQRQNMIYIGGKRRAIGVEDFLYLCPECDSIHCIESRKNDIICSACGHVATINEYGFIENAKFDNLVDWNNYQLEFKKKLCKSEFSSKAIIYRVNYDKLTSRRLGRIKLAYSNKHLVISGKVNSTIPIKDIRYFNLTQRNIITFDYDNEHFFMRIEENNQAFKVVCLGE